MYNYEKEKSFSSFKKINLIRFWFCSVLNENGPPRLIKSGAIRRCGLVGIDVE